MRQRLAAFSGGGSNRTRAALSTWPVTHRMRDVLHRVLTLVLERGGAAVALCHLNGFRHGDAAGLSKRLQAASGALPA
jgi:hypothetical protein